MRDPVSAGMPYGCAIGQRWSVVPGGGELIQIAKNGWPAVSNRNQ